MEAAKAPGRRRLPGAILSLIFDWFNGYQVIKKLIFQFWTLEFSEFSKSYRKCSKTVPKAPPTIPNPSPNCRISTCFSIFFGPLGPTLGSLGGRRPTHAYKSIFEPITGLRTILAGFALFFMQIHVVDLFFGFVKVRFVSFHDHFSSPSKSSEYEYSTVF